jgi:hypothetical protein
MTRRADKKIAAIESGTISHDVYKKLLTVFHMASQFLGG